MKQALFAGILLTLLACSPVRVATDYDKQVDFGQFSTYAYLPDMNTGLGAFDAKRLISFLDTRFQALGLQSSDKPDLLINIKSAAYETPNRTRVGIGIGGTGRRVGGGVQIGVPVGQPDRYLELTLDIVDAKSRNLIFQAIAETKLAFDASPEFKSDRLFLVVQKWLEKYPAAE